MLSLLHFFLLALSWQQISVVKAAPVDPRAPRSSYNFHLSGDPLSNGGLHMYASVGGGPVKSFRVDTGSEGILMASRFIGKDYQATGENFCLEYTSSKNYYCGQWVFTTVTLSSSRASGALKATTALMRVRMAEEFRPGGGAPITDPSKINVLMMGVGFDRDTSSGQTDPAGNLIPNDINPFLRLTEMASGTMTPGFILTPQSIILGITAANSAGFDFVDLQSSGTEWVAPYVTIAVPSAAITIYGAELLIDTGLDYSIVQAPQNVQPPCASNANGACRVANGQKFVLTIPGLPKPLYTFRTGGRDAPQSVSWRHNLHNGEPFINTGMYALREFDYLYDAQAGRLGFQFH
ncbi:hypothetical protein BOTBODRAFT_30676 [Botryobasidium botryosum FD-172 SS1]|uniref:Peptidase A1 domain-containing protein n=1 Tax=Botryobasidium botryosum (strain FD-172 SS1) TaxID=930990 RepID=A0A067MY22_BOTB1|nr:hypothetical protein BOTBODRAFT_30676 [Botryobasidium botryosum FD-172 SS1]